MGIDLIKQVRQPRLHIRTTYENDRPDHGRSHLTRRFSERLVKHLCKGFVWDHSKVAEELRRCSNGSWVRPVIGCGGGDGAQSGLNWFKGRFGHALSALKVHSFLPTSPLDMILQIVVVMHVPLLLSPVESSG
jgi:hypothetical protein